MSTLFEEQQLHPRLYPHQPPRSDPMAFQYTPDVSHPGLSGAGAGGGLRPGYAFSEISCSDYTSSSSRRESRQGLLIVLTFLVEFLLLVSVVVVEYFFRWTDVFPLRRQNFTCNDVSITCTSHNKQLMSNFAFGGNVPEAAIYALSFCVPPLVVMIGELGLYSVAAVDENRIILVMDRYCAIPHIIRRLLRFLGVFVFGGFALMVLSDVTRNVIGRLRPDFLETCRVNVTLCSQLPSLDDSACLNTDKMQLRQARASFPSLHSSLTSYAAVYIAMYIHGAMRCHSVRILRAFLTLVFLLLSAMGGMAEYCTCVSHWTDVVAGWTAGLTMGTYVAVCVLSRFQEDVSQAEIQQMMRAFLGDVYWTYEDKSHLTRPAADQLSSLTVPRIPTMPEPPPPASLPTSVPSAHSPTVAAAAEASNRQQRRRLRPFTMFQRDLSQSVEHHHRRHQAYLQAGASHM